VGSSSIPLVEGYSGTYHSGDIAHYSTLPSSLDIVQLLPFPTFGAAYVYDKKNVFIFGVNEAGNSSSKIFKFDPIQFTLERLEVVTAKGLEIQAASAGAEILLEQ